MTSRFLKISRVRTVALALSAGVLSSLALAGPSLAAEPTAGTACQAADGKITGRGATFQTRAMTAFIAGYKSDFCGPVANDATSGTNMLAYNVAGAPNGSGQGLNAAGCRTDAFAGTDIPYDQGGGTDIAFGNGSLDKLNAAPGTINPAVCAAPGYSPAYEPKTGGVWPDPVNDTTANVMSFPVAGSAVAVITRLDPGAANGCPNRTTQTQAIALTTQAASRLAGGDIKFWDDALLTANNASLVGCHVAVTRVVRFDKSGTTQIMKNYTKNADGARGGATCDPGTSWTTEWIDDNNTSWPGAPGTPTNSTPVAATATCSALTNGGANGNAAVVTAARGLNGSFGYADLADAVVAGTPALTLPTVRNATNTSFQAPSAGNPANCDFAVPLPGTGTPSQAVGLDASRDPSIDIYTNDTYAVNNQAAWPSPFVNTNATHSDVTFKGGKYPICGLTFDLVYTGLNGNAGNNAISRLTANQRRTLYSFFTYVLSPAAQARLASARYAPLPVSFLSSIRAGFQAGF